MDKESITFIITKIIPSIVEISSKYLEGKQKINLRDLDIKELNIKDSMLEKIVVLELEKLSLERDHGNMKTEIKLKELEIEKLKVQTSYDLHKELFQLEKLKIQNGINEKEINIIKEKAEESKKMFNKYLSM
ncbi:MAG: hypothetical protein IPL26_13270 [Leptospiraceae bacterium]|nr:hypothetical protein [Leptospiraceae bacterium]MBP7284851.1 hypothetical protein [Leptospiraceae bacterium]